MLPSRHIIYSTILCIILYPLIGNNVFIVWSASIFIDIDHYLWYIINQKSWNLYHAYKKHEKHEFRHLNYKLNIFHLIELLILIGLLSFYNIIFLYISIGMLFHFILDWIDMFIGPETKKERTWSLIMYFKRRWNT